VAPARCCPAAPGPRRGLEQQLRPVLLPRTTRGVIAMTRPRDATTSRTSRTGVPSTLVEQHELGRRDVTGDPDALVRLEQRPALRDALPPVVGQRAGHAEEGDEHAPLTVAARWSARTSRSGRSSMTLPAGREVEAQSGPLDPSSHCTQRARAGTSSSASARRAAAATGLQRGQSSSRRSSSSLKTLIWTVVRSRSSSSSSDAQRERTRCRR
jgi:hypothetical protein